MAQINPYLTFSGNCKEAMTFYKECLGGEVTFQTVGDIPAEGECPEGMPGQVMHAMLRNTEMILLGTDMIGKDGFIKGNNISISVNCSSEEEINTFFNNLASGGRIVEPLANKFWGATFGCLLDKYGVNWMFNYAPGKK
jgi:PhnB protein